jgi:hypothetical protein
MIFLRRMILIANILNHVRRPRGAKEDIAPLRSVLVVVVVHSINLESPCITWIFFLFSLLGPISQFFSSSPPLYLSNYLTSRLCYIFLLSDTIFSHPPFLSVFHCFSLFEVLMDVWEILLGELNVLAPEFHEPVHSFLTSLSSMSFYFLSSSSPPLRLSLHFSFSSPGLSIIAPSSSLTLVVVL